MRFPEYTRVTYQKNPLVAVICQLRFPKILRIDNEIPVEFQEVIQEDYPNLRTPQDIEIPINIRSSSSPIALKQNVSYEFISKEGDWKIVLTSDFISLSTVKYTTWELFKERLQKIINSFSKQYSPSYFSRIGLRYQDVIVRSELGLQNTSWKELLKFPLIGMLSADEIQESDLIEVFSRFACNLDESDAILTVRHGFAQKGGTTELGYLIDTDIFTEQNTEINDAINRLDFFNKESGRFFHWCISETLKKALEPQPIE
ncbi:MAG: TIGR04255 family protein [Xenococcus sp. (in: cyanobacteria)]